MVYLPFECVRTYLKSIYQSAICNFDVKILLVIKEIDGILV